MERKDFEYYSDYEKVKSAKVFKDIQGMMNSLNGEGLKNVAHAKVILTPEPKDLHLNMYNAFNETIGISESRNIAHVIKDTLRPYGYYTEQQLGNIENAIFANLNTQRQETGLVDLSEVVQVLVKELGNHKIKGEHAIEITNMLMEYRPNEQGLSEQLLEEFEPIMGYVEPKAQQEEKESKTVETSDEYQTKPKAVLDLEQEESELTKELDHVTSTWKASTEKNKDQAYDSDVEAIRNKYLIAKLQELELNCGNGFSILQNEQLEKRKQKLNAIVSSYSDVRDFENKEAYEKFNKELEGYLKDTVTDDYLFANRQELEKKVAQQLGRKGHRAIVDTVINEVRNAVWQDGSALTYYMNVAGCQIDLKAKVAALEHSSRSQWRRDEYNQLQELADVVRSMTMAVIYSKAELGANFTKLENDLKGSHGAVATTDHILGLISPQMDLEERTKNLTDALYTVLRLNHVDISQWGNVNDMLRAPLKLKDNKAFDVYFKDILANYKNEDLTDETVKKQFFNQSVKYMIAHKERTVFRNWLNENIRSMYTRSGIQKNTANAILQLLDAEFVLLGETSKETKARIEALAKDNKLSQEQVKQLADAGVIDPSNEDENNHDQSDDNGEGGNGSNGDGTKKPEQKETTEEKVNTPFEWVPGDIKAISADQLKEIVKARNKPIWTPMKGIASLMEKSIVALGLSCNTKKSMATPSIDRVVKQREKQEKKVEKQQAKENEQKYKKGYVAFTADFTSDSTVFVKTDDKAYTYKEINDLITSNLKEELGKGDKEKITYLICALTQLNRFRSGEDRAKTNKDELAEKKAIFFENVIHDRLDRIATDNNTGFDTNWTPSLSWMKNNQQYVEVLVENIDQFLKEDKTLDLQKLEEEINDLIEHSVSTSEKEQNESTTENLISLKEALAKQSMEIEQSSAMENE